jgi:hypothetical protein
MTNDPTIPTKAEIEDLAQWAETSEFDPNLAVGKAPARRGGRRCWARDA